MAILNSEHLFEQAERLAEAPPAGPPRQVDIRRSISATYYGLYHATVTAAVDRFVGVVHRATSRYGLAYRSVDHAWLRTICEEVAKQNLSAKFAPYAPTQGFGVHIKGFATAFLDLQQQRHSADYDPLIRVNRSSAIAAVALARAAIVHFGNAGDEERDAFLSLLLFHPRR